MTRAAIVLFLAAACTRPAVAQVDQQRTQEFVKDR